MSKKKWKKSLNPPDAKKTVEILNWFTPWGIVQNIINLAKKKKLSKKK